MALSDRNIVITPNKGKSDDPKIVFSGANAAVSAQNVTLRVYPDNAGTLSFEGSAGQLFSITNSLSGTIFSVNDVSGMPSISVDSTGVIMLAPFGGRIGIGTTSSFGMSSNIVSLYGTANVTGNIRLINATAGGSGIYFPDGTFQTTSSANRPSFGTAGTIQYAGAGNTFAGNSGSLVWDTANSRLGVGTSSPNSVFNVNGTNVPLFQTSNALIGGNNFEIMVGNSTVHGVTLGYVNNTTVPYGYLSAGTSTRNIIVGANGRVGIGGAAAPQTILDVGGGAVFGATWAGNTNFINPPTNGLSVQGSVGVGTYTPLSTLDVNGWAGFRQGFNAAGAVTVASLASNGAVSGTTGTFTGALYGASFNTAGSATVSSLVSNVSIGLGGAALNSFKQTIYGGALGTTLNSTTTMLNLYSTSSNADYLEFINIRNASGGTSWTTSGMRMQQRVDSTWMGWVGFNNGNTTVTNNGGISFGAGTSTLGPNGVPEVMRIDVSGNVGIATTTVQTGFTLQVQGNASFTNRVGVGTSTITGVGNAAVVYGTANLFGNVRLSNTTAGGSGIYFPDGTFQSTAFSSTINLSRQSYTATASQTTFTVTAGYLPGALDVYQNGSKLNIPLDVTATNGSTFVLASPATAGDIIEAVGYGGSLVTIANAVPLGGGTMTGDLSMSSGTRSTSTSTGAIVVTTTGGIGVGGNVVAGSLQPTLSVIPPNGMYLPSANTLGFATNNTLRFSIDDSGDTGFGTTPLAGGTVTFSTTSAPVLAGDGGYYGGGAYWDSAWKNSVSSQGGWAMRNSSGVFTVYTGPSPGAAGSTFATFAERLRIAGNGNVGIATTNPQDVLHVFGGNISIGDPAANVTVISSSYITLTTQGNLPATPPSGDLQVFAKNIAGRGMFAQQGPSGIDTTFTPLLGRNRIYYWAPPGLNTTTAPTASLSATAFTTVGTATARAFATTNVLTRMTRVAYVSVATVGGLASLRVASAWLTTGTGTGLGGLTYVCRFGVTDAAAVAGARMFVGLSSNTGAATNVEPSTLTNSFGVAQLSTDNTQWYFVYGGSAAQTAIALGTALGAPTTTTTAWDLALFSSPGANGVIGYTMTNLGTGASVTGVITPGTPGTQTPANTTALTFQMWRTNNATALAVAMDFMSLYIETDD